MNKIRLIKPLFWIGSSVHDIRALPEVVQDTFGFALHRAQQGAKHELDLLEQRLRRAEEHYKDWIKGR